MKRLTFFVILLCTILLLASCSAKFTDIQRYAEKLQNEGYTVNIISGDESSIPEWASVTKFAFDYILMKADSSLTAEQALMAANGDRSEVITVMYFANENAAKNAENVFDKSKSELAKIFGEYTSLAFSQSGKVLKITVKYPTDIE